MRSIDVQLLPKKQYIVNKIYFALLLSISLSVPSSAFADSKPLFGPVLQQGVVHVNGPFDSGPGYINQSEQFVQPGP